ncbi:hypothetical protein ACJIZ3_004856 [Penstemon smallii]|uniref:RNA-dependent RNA polymerase n=1 Tax=Penstemon smallii TaxID=265156 RepID=A0ABD3S3F7_9LAMI
MVFLRENEKNPLNFEKDNTFSNNDLVPILHSHEGLELPYRMIFHISRLVQKGYISGPNLDTKFYELVHLKKLSGRHIDHFLEKLYNLKECCYDPVRWLEEQNNECSQLTEKPKSLAISLDEGLVYVHRVQVTSTKLYFCGPDVNISNCVLRHLENEIDNFFRVSFMILETIRRGIKIENKKFDFLVHCQSFSFGSSTKTLSVSKHDIEYIPDIEFCYRVKEFLLSAFQIRSSSSSMKLSLRPSMLKYDSDNFKLDKKQREAVAQLDDSLTNPSRAQNILDLMSPGENTNILKLKCGYKPNEEPFLLMMLQTFRSSKFLDLRMKARIFIPDCHGLDSFKRRARPSLETPLAIFFASCGFMYSSWIGPLLSFKIKYRTRKRVKLGFLKMLCLSHSNGQD